MSVTMSSLELVRAFGTDEQISYNLTVEVSVHTVQISYNLTVEVSVHTVRTFAASVAAE